MDYEKGINTLPVSGQERAIGKSLTTKPLATKQQYLAS